MGEDYSRQQIGAPSFDEMNHQKEPYISIEEEANL